MRALNPKPYDPASCRSQQKEKRFCAFPSPWAQAACRVRRRVRSAHGTRELRYRVCGCSSVCSHWRLVATLHGADALQAELCNALATAIAIDDRPSCFRFPRGNGIGVDLAAYGVAPSLKGTPWEVG